MKKWKVIRDCFGYKGRYWTADEIVELEDDATPPPHFQPAETEQKRPVGRPRLDVMKPVDFEPGKPVTVKGGFGSSLPTKEPINSLTAGKALKDQK